MGTLKEDCKAAIYEYAPLERQNTAAICGIHQGYVHLVITEFREHYENLKRAGETEWYIPEYLKAALDADKPY
jgi:hypothetical protein